MIGRARAGVAALAAAAATATAIGTTAHAGVSLHRGDWEATGAGSARGSFAIGAVARHAGGSGLAVEDLAVDVPISCIDSPHAPAPVYVDVVTQVMPITPHGTFTGGKITKGTGTVVSGRLVHGAIELSYRHVSATPNPRDGGVERCRTGTVRLRAQPGTRHPVKEGAWVGKTAAGETVQFYVAAGGRALLTPSKLIRGQTDYAWQIEPSAAGDNCTGSSNVGYGSGTNTGAGPGAGFVISDALFVDATGAFDNSELQFGDSPGVSGTFASLTQASGSFSNPSEGCTGPVYNWSAAPQ